jgi:hypothetical protein
MIKKIVLLVKALLLFLMIWPLRIYHEQTGYYVDKTLDGQDWPITWLICDQIVPVVSILIIIYLSVTVIMLFMKKFEYIILSDAYTEVGVSLFWLIILCLMVLGLPYLSELPLGNPG